MNETMVIYIGISISIILGASIGNWMLGCEGRLSLKDRYKYGKYGIVETLLGRFIGNITHFAYKIGYKTYEKNE